MELVLSVLMIGGMGDDKQKVYEEEQWAYDKRVVREVRLVGTKKNKNQVDNNKKCYHYEKHPKDLFDDSS